jgi:putative tricarboxylic transport membrane protein
MTSRRTSEVLASALLTALAAAACVGAWRLGPGTVHTPGPGFMPLAVAALLGLMALGRLVRVAAETGEAGDSRPFARSRWGVVAIVLGTLTVFGLAIERVGFTPSTVVVLFVLFGPVARKRWWIALTAAVAIAIAARIGLTAVGMQLPPGPWGL